MPKSWVSFFKKAYFFLPVPLHNIIVIKEVYFLDCTVLLNPYKKSMFIFVFVGYSCWSLVVGV